MMANELVRLLLNLESFARLRLQSHINTEFYCRNDISAACTACGVTLLIQVL